MGWFEQGETFGELAPFWEKKDGSYISLRNAIQKNKHKHTYTHKYIYTHTHMRTPIKKKGK